MFKGVNERKVVLLTLLVMLIGLTSVHAFTVTLNPPTNNQNITSTITAQCTTDATSNLDNGTLQYYSNGWQTIATNSTAGTSWTFSLSPSAVPDGAYTLRCVAELGGDNETASANVTNIGFDDTTPTVTISTYTERVRYGDSFTLTGSCSDTGFPNDVCTCTFYEQKGYEKSNGDSVTVSGSSISYSFTPTLKGWRKFYVVCQDAHGLSTTTSEYQFKVQSSTGGGGTRIVHKGVTSGGEIAGNPFAVLIQKIKGFFDWIANLFKR